MQRTGEITLKLRSIQVLRGVAAMAVVAHHAFPGTTSAGAAGVDLFFVVSGFIMATCAGGRSPLEFLADRAWRIYPLWLIALAPWLAINPQDLLHVVRSVTLWPVYGDQFLNPALGVGWTLSFEFLFYLGFALALATRPMAPLLLFFLCLVLGLETNHVLFWFLGSPLTFEFLLGVAITRLQRNERAGTIAVVLGLVWFALSPPGFYNQAFGVGALYRTLAWGVPAALVVYGAWSLERRFSGRAFNFFVLLGSASYSIYLFHQLVMLEFQGLAGFVISALAGIAAFLGLERPIMKRRPRWGRRHIGQAQEARSASLLT